jgi:cytochrome c oxidase cbb3-type subunit 3
MAESGDDHVYDGIQELDNDLPRWWRLMFIATIVWGLWYPLHYHDGRSLGEARLVAEQASAAEERAKHETGPVSEETLRALSHSEEHVARGGQLFIKNGCAVCHGPEATGLVGPNLRDDYWLYGSDLTDIVGVITDGRANNAMPAQKAALSGGDIRDLALWIADQARSHKAAGKAPDPARERLAPIGY